MLTVFGNWPGLHDFIRASFIPAPWRNFEGVVIYFRSYDGIRVMVFLLGFYVSIVAGRWWMLWKAIPWSTNLATIVSTYLRSNDVSTSFSDFCALQLNGISSFRRESSVISKVNPSQFCSRPHHVSHGSKIIRNYKPKVWTFLFSHANISSKWCHPQLTRSKLHPLATNPTESSSPESKVNTLPSNPHFIEIQMSSKSAKEKC